MHLGQHLLAVEGDHVGVVRAHVGDVELVVRSHRFSHPSFEAYFEQYERGWDAQGQAYLALPEKTRQAVREDIRQSVGDTGGPIDVDVQYRFASGRR